MATRGLSAELGALVDKQVQASEGEKTLQDVIAGLAEACGMKIPEVSAYLAGDSTCPPMDCLEAWSKALGVESSALVDAAKQDGCEYDSAPEKKPEAKKPMDSEEDVSRSAKLIRAIAPQSMRALADKLILEGSTVDEARQVFLRKLQKDLAPVGSQDPVMRRTRIADIDDQSFLGALTGSRR